jgi:hypothetical protein
MGLVLGFGANVMQGTERKGQWFVEIINETSLF